MIVIIAWISFWVNHKSGNVRLTFSALPLLLMVISCQLISSQIPKTSYTKAVDVYTGVCMTFVFVALVGK